jgi:hypothetical protein
LKKEDWPNIPLKFVRLKQNKLDFEVSFDEDERGLWPNIPLKRFVSVKKEKD